MLHHSRSDLILGGIRIFKTKAGFRYAVEHGAIIIKRQSVTNSKNYRMYIYGKHVHIKDIADMFHTAYHTIVVWRDLAWKNVYSSATRKRNVGFTTNLPLGTPVDIIEAVDILLVTAYDNLDQTDSKKVDRTMNQLKRLERAKQKQREYCTRYGMNEELIARNLNHAENLFWDREDEHAKTNEHRKEVLRHNIKMLESGISQEADIAFGLSAQIYKLQTKAETSRRAKKAHKENLELSIEALKLLSE
ncbi:MAG: hypothetical protein HRT61_00645 [Ekhidna sp.]|nr:hypothetical protein [Ekhidna sp.]